MWLTITIIAKYPVSHLPALVTIISVPSSLNSSHKAFISNVAVTVMSFGWRGGFPPCAELLEDCCFPFMEPPELLGLELVWWWWGWWCCCWCDCWSMGDFETVREFDITLLLEVTLSLSALTEKRPPCCCCCWGPWWLWDKWWLLLCCGGWCTPLWLWIGESSLCADGEDDEKCACWGERPFPAVSKHANPTRKILYCNNILP